MPYTPDDYRRAGRRLLGARVLRDRRWRTRGTYAEDIGISVRTVADVETGRIGKRRDWDPGTIAILERAVGWAPGSYDAVLAGREPTPLDDQTPDLPEEIVVRTRDILDNPNLTEAMREEMLAVLMDAAPKRSKSGAKRIKRADGSAS